MSLMKTLSRLLAPSAALLLLAGCQVIPEAREDPSHFYTLGVPRMATGEASATEPVQVSLLPIELPAYLHKGLLVVRKGENEVRYSDYDRWAEPLEAAIARSLQAGIQADPRFNVSLHAGGPAQRCELRVRVQQAEGLALTGTPASVRFVAVVELQSTGEQPRLLARRVFTAPPAAWDGQSQAALAKGLGEAVDQLAREISELLAAKVLP